MKRLAWLVLLASCAPSGPTPDRPTTPWKGKAAVIPGVVEAEHYDDGPAEVAYHDIDAKNEGVAYRGATGGDIEGRPDASNLHGIGWTRAGEWLVYTVDIRESGTYTIEMPVASNKEGGTFRLEFDGVDRTGAIRVPDTGGWKILKTIQKDGVKLEAGLRTMRVVMIDIGPSRSIGDIDLFKFVRTGP